MSLDFSLDVHMSSYDKLKEELSIYEMYTLLMAGTKIFPSAYNQIPRFSFVLVHDSSYCVPVERQLLFLYGINMQTASMLSITWKWQVVVQFSSFSLA